MRIGMLVASTVLLFSIEAASAECRFSGVNAYFNQESEAAITVSSGSNCGFSLNASSQVAFERTQIVARPKHGTASPRSGAGVTYKSASGYKGEDSFVISITGRGSSGPGTATIKVRVTVK